MDVSRYHRDQLTELPGQLAAVFRLLSVFPESNERVQSTAAQLQRTVESCGSNETLSLSVHIDNIRIGPLVLPEPPSDQHWDWFRQLLDDIPLAGVRLQAPVDLSEVAELAAACLADLATLSQQLESISVIERRFDAHRFDAETNLDADVDGAL
ncbi:MAG: hypothetical protein AAF196_20585, partial [Planctomycetota bacterium]